LPKNQIKGKRKPGVKLELSKLKEACGDQLAPFEGLWGYERSQDSYHGTIFRFPLRATKTKSVLKTSSRDLNISEVRRLMNSYFDEARVSLLFLRRIKSIDFSIWGQPDSAWSVTRRPPLDEDAKSFSELVVCSFVNKGEFGPQISGKDKWWVAIEDLLPTADRLPESSRRVMKNVECGLAALISSKLDDTSASTPEVIQSKMFYTLPLPICSDLPVHIHATFALSGDRQSISVDQQGAQSHGAEWNRYLLQDALPKLYLSFLDDLGKQVRQDVFNFWPGEEPPKRSCAEILCASFWEELPKSSQRLFPKAQPATQLSQRRAAQLFDINQAVFDFLPKDSSEALAPLLISLGVNLVRHIPPGVMKHLKALPEVTSVKGPMLRQLLKSERTSTCLLKEMAENPRIWEILLHQLIQDEAELEDLDGCHILPLADGSLAPLNYIIRTDDSQASSYYLASKKELVLFNFASRCLVPSKFGLKLGQVVESGKFDVTTLRISHAKRLLEMRPKATSSTPNPETDKWLTEFWKFWNASIDTPPEIEDLDVAIFRTALDGTQKYATPSEFYQLPAVVEPADSAHQKLCDKILGLYRFDPKFMPKSLSDSHTSFQKSDSFYKFVRALRMLAGDTGIGTFVQTLLDVSHLEVNSLQHKSKFFRLPELHSYLKYMLTN
jgi:sacsin